MAVYVCTMLVLCIFSVLEIAINKSPKAATIRHIMAIFSFGMLIFVTIFRSTSVGGDLVNYEMMFYNFNDPDYLKEWGSWHYDVGFVFLNWLIGRFTTNFHTFMVTIGLLTWLPLICCIKKYSQNISLSLVMLLAVGEYSYLFSGLRQGLAMAIVFFAAMQLAEGHRVRYFLFLVIAVSIHSTAIIGVLFWLVAITKRKDFFILKVASLFFVFSSIALIGIPYLVSQYETNDYSEFIVSGEGWKLLLFIAMIMVVCSVLRKHIPYSIHNVDQFAFNSCLIASLVQILALGFSLLTRLIEYFTAFFTILIPNIVMKEKGRANKMIIILCVLAISSLYYFYILHQNLSRIVPYRFY